MAVRERFPASGAASGFSLEVPGGMTVCGVPEVEVDLEDPAQARPLALLASSEGGPHLAAAWRPAYGQGNVTDWLAMLVEHFGIEVTGALSGFVGGAEHRHPAMFVEGRQSRGGAVDVVRIAAIEDGGSFFTVHARCPEAAWAAWSAALEGAVASLELAEPQGPTVPCVPGGPVVPVDMPGVEVGEWPRGRGWLREPAFDEAGWSRVVERARALVGAGKFDEAEGVLREADGTSRYERAARELYEARLRELAGRGRRGAADEVFRRAVRWSCCWPDPHTEYEAEEAERAYAEVRSRLVGVLGYDPDKG